MVLMKKLDQECWSHVQGKGKSKASFDLLFRVLFNTTIEVDYPKIEY